MGGHGILYPPHLKKRGDTSPSKLRPWSNVKNSSHKTWQTSLLVLKPLQIQTLREKSGGDMAYYVPPSTKVGGHVPRVPHQIAPMPTISIKSLTRVHLSTSRTLECLSAHNFTNALCWVIEALFVAVVLLLCNWRQLFFQWKCRDRSMQSCNRRASL